MFKIFLIFMFISNLYASMSSEFAKGQNPVKGSFYLESDRTRFRNPAKLYEAPDMLYLESEGELGYKNNDWAISLGRKIKEISVIDGFYQFNEFSGINANLGALNGMGVETYGLTLGMNFDDSYSAYMGFQDSKGEDLTPKFGFTLNAYYGVLFGEYFGQIFSVPRYKFTLGFGKEWNQFFGDLTYNQVHSDQKSKDLTLTVGGKKMVSPNLYLIGSGSQELFFNKNLDINLGVEFKPISKLEIDLAYSFDAWAMKNPKYEDFNFKGSIKYLF